MQLELADSFLDDDMELTTLPALDPITGEIYAINATAMSLLSPEEQDEILYQAPFLIQKIQEQTNGTMSAGLFSKIRDKVNAFKAKLPLKGKLPGIAAIGAIVAGIRRRRAAQNLPQLSPAQEQAAATQEAAAQGMSPADPKFGLNVQIDPDPKPWYARPGVLLPVLGGIVLIGAIALRRKK